MAVKQAKALDSRASSNSRHRVDNTNMSFDQQMLSNTQNSVGSEASWIQKIVPPDFSVSSISKLLTD